MNIIHHHGKLYIIDWGRAGEVPLRFIDLVYFMAGVRDIRSLEEWKKVIPIFTKYTNTDAKTAETPYCATMMFKTLRKKYPKEYFQVVEYLSCE